MATIMEQLSQAAAPRDNSNAPAFKTSSMKAPDLFYGTRTHKLRGLSQLCQLIFHNDPANFFSDRKKVLYSTSFLTGRAGKWIEPYLSKISHEYPSYLLNNWKLFEIQSLILFGDPNEVRKCEQELNNSRIKESGHVSLYITYVNSLMSRIGDWGERDTRYHERQKEKGSHQEKKPPITGSNPSRPPQDSYSNRYHYLPKGEDLILDYDFLYHFNPIIGWKNGLITYDSSHKDSSGIKSSASNALATAVNSVALVCELKTPSLPSSVHIPPIIPSQSLLPLRDEVFKEIKDVGEDVAISSLHLFQGDMDLPPLSFHASLEEQWDEEEEPEEIETVLKVVPPAYHQYLDVFSKVKAEKLPPHRSCDHHIELKGLLPPVGVIYSLSNQESETLQAYISDSVEKGFIRPYSS
ncbi:hypothetical protein O181_068184 [Austropuccinia psidii MF-1]|uniref:Retrotransposon gag domain-containing protein n=1 Tax=Austropuccinia psidii MF-1 TaxID=1389203 RepID=A0A9Q3EWT1_9BASI|nr:hypothetical protein [Austropuccinia psidii MF-1]